MASSAFATPSPRSRVRKNSVVSKFVKVSEEADLDQDHLIELKKHIDKLIGGDSAGGNQKPCTAAATQEEGIGLGKKIGQKESGCRAELDSSIHFTAKTLVEEVMKSAADVEKRSNEMIRRRSVDAIQELNEVNEKLTQAAGKAKEEANGMMAERDWYYLKIMRIKEATELELERCEADPHNGLPRVFARFISDLCVSED